MHHRSRSFVLALCAALLVLALPMPGINAQSDPDAHTSYQLHMRTGPGPQHAIITTLAPGVGLVFEARNGDMAWLLGHTEDGAFRGWVSSLYLTFTPGFAAMRLPYSDEILNAPAPQAPAPAAPGDSAPAGPVNGGGLENVPIIPTISGRVREIFLRGQALGNDPRAVTKVGECNTMSHAFLVPFGTGQYILGQYGDLQPTIDYFTTFTNTSAAAGQGYTSALVVDPSMGDPSRCPANTSPLECEYQRLRPSVAMVMLGTHDVYFLTPGQYEAAMRRIVTVSIDYGVIPVLTTFPTWPGDYSARTENRVRFNQILLNLSREYGIPLVNFWRAAQVIPHSGIGEDFVHITETGDNWARFNGEETQWGFTMWNLVALQTLDQIRQNALY